MKKLQTDYPSGGKNRIKTKLQRQKFIILRIALNRALLKPVFRSKKGALSVGIGEIYCKKRISVPMSYIIFYTVTYLIYNYNYNVGAAHKQQTNNNPWERRKGRTVSINWTKSKFNHRPLR